MAASVSNQTTTGWSEDAHANAPQTVKIVMDLDQTSASSVTMDTSIGITAHLIVRNVSLMTAVSVASLSSLNIPQTLVNVVRTSSSTPLLLIAKIAAITAICA